MDWRWKEREKEGGGRKSSIVSEETGRPSVASTCCASRSHFTPLSSPNSVPFFIFLPFFFNLFYPQNDTRKIDSTPLLNLRLFLPHFLNFPQLARPRARARATTLCVALPLRQRIRLLYRFSALCFTICIPQRKLYIYFFIAF